VKPACLEVTVGESDHEYAPQSDEATTNQEIYVQDAGSNNEEEVDYDYDGDEHVDGYFSDFARLEELVSPISDPRDERRSLALSKLLSACASASLTVVMGAPDLISHLINACRLKSPNLALKCLLLISFETSSFAPSDESLLYQWIGGTATTQTWDDYQSLLLFSAVTCSLATGSMRRLFSPGAFDSLIKSLVGVIDSPSVDLQSLLYQPSHEGFSLLDKRVLHFFFALAIRGDRLPGFLLLALFRHSFRFVFGCLLCPVMHI
jgi:hypothetical protein